MRPNSFFSELRRRNVYKVATVYAITAWLIVQVCSIATTSFAAPAWVMKVLIIFLIAGFPIALIFAWAFELTPEGIRRTTKSSEGDTERKNLNFKMWIIGLLVLALIVLGAERIFFAKSTILNGETELLEASIAVLPFADFSPEGDQEYFADGISEEILNALAKVEGIQVAGRTSSFQFKNENRDLKKIGDSLGVDHILEGSVRKAGNNLRITAQLIRADNGFHIWTETYNKAFSTKDIFAIQDEIAIQVLQALKIKMLPSEINDLKNVPTSNKEAYDTYLKGKSKAASYNPEDLNQAIELFDKAIKLDPKFALAYTEKAVAYVHLHEIGNVTREEANEQIRKSLDWALLYNPKLAEAYSALSSFQLQNKNYDQALAFAKKAVDLKPGDADIRIEYKKALGAVGESEKSEQQTFMALKLNPLSAYVNTEVAMIYYGKANYDLAEKHFLKAIEIQPDMLAAYEGLGAIYGLKKNRFDKAIILMHKALQEVDQKSLTFRLLIYPSVDLNLDGFAKHYLDKLMNDFPKNEMAIDVKTYYLYKQEKYSEIIQLHKEFQSKVASISPYLLLIELPPAYILTNRSKEFMHFLEEHRKKFYNPDNMSVEDYLQEPLGIIHAALVFMENSKADIAKSLASNLITVIEDNLEKNEYLVYNANYFLAYCSAHEILGNKEKALRFFKERAKNQSMHSHWMYYDLKDNLYFNFTKEELAPYHEAEKKEIERQRKNVIIYLKKQNEWKDSWNEEYASKRK